MNEPKRDPGGKLALIAEADRLRRQIAFESGEKPLPLIHKSPRRASYETLARQVSLYRRLLNMRAKLVAQKSEMIRLQTEQEIELLEAVDRLKEQQPWRPREAIEAELRAKLDRIESERAKGH